MTSPGRIKERIERRQRWLAELNDVAPMQLMQDWRAVNARLQTKMTCEVIW